ncbi:MAG: carbohydrate ABC transporter permease [Fimbriimonadaceae bacterium]
MQFARAARIGRWYDRLAKFGVWTLLLAGSIMFMLPMYIMLCVALKTPEQVATTSPWEWPATPTWENFLTVLSDPVVHFGRLFGNTLFLAVAQTFGVTMTAAMVAYPFARLSFRGRDRLFIVLLGTMMLPGAVTMIPGYVIIAKLGWVNTFLPFVVPAFFGGGAFNVFLLRQFFLGIPREMDEAAKIDGASNAVIFWKVILPNAGPALATVGVFTFMGSWRDFMGPLLYLNDPEKQTLEMGLRTFQTMQETQWHLLMAASVLVSLPLLIMFLLSQRYFVRGILLSGGK